MASVYLQNAVILMAASLVLRAAGMVLRVVLAAHLGGEGMGLYQLVFTAYGVSIAAAVGGISVVSTRLFAEILARGDAKSAKRLLRRLILAGATLGSLAGAAQYFLSGPAARWILGDLRAVPALRVLAFSLPFMAMGAAIRGYFMAVRNVRPNVLSQLLEQSVRLGLILWLLQRVRTAYLGQAVAMVTIGNSMSEAVSCLLMLRFAAKEKRKLESLLPQNSSAMPGWGKILKIFLPVEGNRLTSSLLRAAETSLVPACLALYVGSRSAALAQFGELRGMALPLLTFPFSFLATLSGLLMPEIARAHSRRNQTALHDLVGRTMAITWGVSLFAGAFFTLWAIPLGRMIYHDANIGWYLAWLGPIVPFMYLESMVDGIMKGIGEQLASFRYEMLNAVFRLLGILFLLPQFGIKGYVALVAISNLLTCLLNFGRMLRVLQIPFAWNEWIVKPGILLLASLLVCMGVQGAVRQAGEALRFLLPAGSMALFYMLLLWQFSLRKQLGRRMESKKE